MNRAKIDSPLEGAHCPVRKAIKGKDRKIGTMYSNRDANTVLPELWAARKKEKMKH